MNNYIATTDEMRKSLLDQMLAFYNLPVESIEKDLWVTQVLWKSRARLTPEGELR